MSNDKPKRTRTVRPISERIVAARAALEALEARQRTEELANDPRFAGINELIAAVEAKHDRADRTINGKGRLKPAPERIAALRAEADDLEIRATRDAAVLLVSDDHLSALRSVRDRMASGELDADTYKNEVPSMPEALRKGTYSLTQMEREQEAEAAARAEKKAQKGETATVENETPENAETPEPTPETETVS